jgi:hypothetical protein
VVRGARAALKTGDAEQVLVWIPAGEQGIVIDALEDARAVRRLGQAARKLADQYFVETVARLHCLALDQAFLGIAPAGYDFGPAVLAAEEAVATGDVDRLVRVLQRELDQTVREHWIRVQQARQAYQKGDLDAGRRYALTYLDFIDFAAAIHALVQWGEFPQRDDYNTVNVY